MRLIARIASDRAHLLLLPESQETDTRYLHHLEPYSRNITLGFTPSTETRDEDFVVVIDKVEATVVLRTRSTIVRQPRDEKTYRYESGDLFAVFN